MVASRIAQIGLENQSRRERQKKKGGLEKGPTVAKETKKKRKKNAFFSLA